MESKIESLPLDSLLLDPNNYRLQDSATFAKIESDRFHLPKVQAGTLHRLQNENLKVLRDSIFSNGYLDIERIIVTPYSHSEGKYLVLEGNRRIAALMQLRKEEQAGVDVPSHVVETFVGVPCFILSDASEGNIFQKTLMGIRHVGGIKEWGGFQRAKLIADLIDEHDVDYGDVSMKLGISANETLRRYRAYKALDQMINDDNFGDQANSTFYPLFHEAIAVPIVREWLGWDQENYRFSEAVNLEHFYQLIVPRENSDEDESDNKILPPKIATYSDVRKLREILPNQAACASLLNLSENFSSAIALVDQDKQSKRWKEEVKEAKKALESLPPKMLRELGEKDIEIILELKTQAEQTLQDITLLTKT